MAATRCRFCQSPLQQSFADLGSTPLANSYLRPEELAGPEPSLPLHARVCGKCFLVQIPEMASPESLFGDYAYYSSYSTSWLDHSARFAFEATERFGLTADSLVVEVASNDGYLLKYFQESGIPVLGIEPARNIAKDANAAGVPTEAEFFGFDVASNLVARGYSPDLIVGNNVLAHVPDINDFVAGLAALLRSTGVLSVEFPHLLRLIEGVQFDTIYHEHFSYLSLTTVEKIFAAHGLVVFDVSEIPTHGGSLRVFAELVASATRSTSHAVDSVRKAEAEAGLNELTTYAEFAKAVELAKDSLRGFLEEARANGRTVAAYGAAAKGNTLLNTVGVTSDLIEYVVDRSPHKQGLYLPGSHLPIYPPERIEETQPDYVLILPWNLADEITEQMATVATWGGRFVVAIPTTRVIA